MVLTWNINLASLKWAFYICKKFVSLNERCTWSVRAEIDPRHPGSRSSKERESRSWWALQRKVISLVMFQWCLSAGNQWQGPGFGNNSWERLWLESWEFITDFKAFLFRSKKSQFLIVIDPGFVLGRAQGHGGAESWRWVGTIYLLRLLCQNRIMFFYCSLRRFLPRACVVLFFSLLFLSIWWCEFF